MAKFKYRLATLLRLRESARDERRTQLAQAYRAEAMVLEAQARLAAESAGLTARIRATAGPGEVHVDSLLDAQRFVLVLKARHQELAHQRQQVEAEIQRRRQALVEANREVQVLEKLRERQRARWQEEENRQEVKRLDEVAVRSHVKEEP
jgi:flagellar export protein FliJ